MKRYKLLKDLPNFNKGDEFYISEKDGGLVRVSDDVYAFSRLALEKCPNILKDGEWFEKIPDEYKRWRAECSETYWYLDDCGVTLSKTDWDEYTDDFRYSVGNHFKTEEEAKTHKEYLLAKQVLIDDADGGKFISITKNWYASYDVLGWDLYRTYDYSPGQIYFKDEESLKKSLEKHKEQWEIVRRYEMGE